MILLNYNSDSSGGISENAASALVRLLLDLNLICIKAGNGSEIKPGRSSRAFRIAGGATIVMRVVKERGNRIRLPRKQMLQRLMSLPIPFFGVYAEEELCGSLKASRFEVFACERKEWNRFGKIDIAVSPAGSLEHFSRLVTDGAEEILSILKARPNLSFTLKMEKKNMNNESIAPTLNLGRVEISLRDFLTLRRGDVLTFNLPSEVEGVLQVYGNDWAFVGVEFDGENLKLRVKEVGSR